MNYRIGSLYATITACLLSTQEPFSFLAARDLSTLQFICLAQIALLVSIPLLMTRQKARRDLAALIRDRSNYPKFGVILAIGLTGLLLYTIGLSKTHPIIVSVILNLSPFWAALVALIVMRVPIPVSPLVFFACFAGAFLGAMAVTWSQIDVSGRPSSDDLKASLLAGDWLYIVPIPLLYALTATLVGKWFSKYDESAAIAVNFLTANVVLIPSTLVALYLRSELTLHHFPAILLMVVGTILAGSIARVLYQVALNVTGGDNGFVSMFFNLVPALTALISFLLSYWIRALHFAFEPLFFLGLACIVVALFTFSVKSWGQAAPARAEAKPGASAAG